MPDHKAVKIVMSVIETVSPSAERVSGDVANYRHAHPNLTKLDLASAWGDSTCWRFAGEGAATAIPGMVPALGTAAQIAIEAGAISADVLYMIRCMAGLTLGIGLIYERDVQSCFNDEFVKVLGTWCGALTLSRESAKRIGTKLAVGQFKRVPGAVFKRVNRRVGTTIVTKYGSRRGGVALGTLIPFGIGVLVGGGFNLFTMKAFKKAAINYFKHDGVVVMDG